MSNSVDVRALLDSVSGGDPSLERIIASALTSRGAALLERTVPLAELWSAESFGLDRLPRFTGSDSGERAAILERCATDRLQEAWLIEKLGLAFCSKMTLLADKSDERMLYALMCGDEASHFAAVSRFVDAPARLSPFARLLGSVVETGTKSALTLLVQVVLEGWGIGHYSALARDCHDFAVQATFDSILIDEARHHGSGLLLLRKGELSDGDRDEIVSFLGELLAMVRCGPQSVVAALSPRDVAEAAVMFAQLEDGSTLSKLQTIRELITRAGCSDVVATLEARGAFEPLPPADCAAIFFGASA